MVSKWSVRLSSRTRKDSTYYIIRVTINGKRKDYSSNIIAKPSDFKRGVLSNTKKKGALNAKVHIVEEYLENEEKPTFDYIEKLLLGKKEKPNLSEMFDKYIEEQGIMKAWSVASFKKYNTIKNRFADFNENLNINDINDDLLVEFFKFLEDIGYKNTSLMKMASFIRTFLRWASKKELYSSNSFNTFLPHLRGGGGEYRTIVFLTEEELKKLEYATFKEAHLTRVRDIFVFSCYSGLRFSDVMNLSWANIINEEIHFVTQKTTDNLSIPLNTHTQEILERYKSFCFPNNKVFSRISNQKANDYIKDACKECGINAPVTMTYFRGQKRYEETFEKYQVISFHAGRRTFITHALRLGIPSEVIMKFSGHHSHEMLKPYMAVVDELKHSEMEKFNKM